MKILTKMLVQTAIYWKPIGLEETSEYKLDLPIDIKCRWEDELEQGIDQAGTETTFKSTVYVDRDVEEGGKIMLGKRDDLKGPNPPEEAQRIRMFSKIPTLNGKQYLRTVKL